MSGAILAVGHDKQCQGRLWMSGATLGVGHDKAVSGATFGFRHDEQCRGRRSVPCPTPRVDSDIARRQAEPSPPPKKHIPL